MTLTDTDASLASKALMAAGLGAVAVGRWHEKRKKQTNRDAVVVEARR